MLTESENVHSVKETGYWWESITSQIQMETYEVDASVNQNVQLAKHVQVCSIQSGHPNATKLKPFSVQTFWFKSRMDC